jgi:hypothetical protein
VRANIERVKHALLPLLLLAACAHRTPPSPAPPAQAAATEPASDGPAAAPSPSLEAVRAGAEAVLRAQAETYWRAFTEGEPADPAAAWRGHEELLSDASLAEFRAAGSAGRGAAHLRAWLVGERLARDAAEPIGRLARARGEATFTRAGHEVPLAEAPTLLASEPDASRRRAIAAAAAGAERALLPAVEAREERLREATRALGYPSTSALAAELRGEPTAALGALAEAVLARTDATWGALLSELAARAGMAPAEVRIPDLPRLLRSAAPARDFPAARQLETAGAILAGVGLDLQAQPGLRLDAAARPRKLPQTVALPIDPPRDVRVSISPLAGIDGLRALLHELGAAEYYAHVTAPAVELRRLGPAALPLAWALLVEEVAGAPAWLSGRGLAEPLVRAEASAAAARRLLRAREAAGRLLSSLARAQGGPSDRDVALAARVFGVPAVEADVLAWRLDPDPLLRSAELLRAELLAAQVESLLVRRAGGPAWWASTAAGAWLRAAWAEGSRRTVAEISATTGHPALDAGALDTVVRARAAAQTAPGAS